MGCRSAILGKGQEVFASCPIGLFLQEGASIVCEGSADIANECMKSRKRIIVLLAAFTALIVILPAQVSAVPFHDDFGMVYADTTEGLLEGAGDEITGGDTTETATSSTNHYINGMMKKIHGWYILGRNIAVPLAILSFASCGFKILLNVLSTKGEYRFDAIMRQFIYTGLAIALILMLPVIVQTVIDIVKRVAWKPPK